MAVRTIKFTVAENGITPAVKQFGGVQGDHRSTEVIFELSPQLFSDIRTQAEELGGSTIYRIDGYDGEGGVARSETSPLMADEIPYYLEEWITRYGGTVRIVLVISLFKDDTTEMELYSFPALLSLKNLPDGKDTSGENYESMSTLSEVARESAEKAIEAAGKTEAARFALENGSTFIFDGNGTFGAVDPVFVVDSALSEQSENAVMNKVVSQKISEIEQDNDLSFNNINQQIEELIQEIDSIPKVVDQSYNEESENAQSGKAISGYIKPILTDKFISGSTFKRYVQSWDYLTAIPWYTENMSSIDFLSACPQHCSFTVSINEHTFSDFPYSGTFYGILHVMCGSANYRMMTAYQIGGGNIYFCAKIVEQSSVTWKKITLTNAT